MSLFSRLFRKAPPAPPTLGSRVANLERQPDSVVVNIALGNDDAQVRLEAVKKLRYGEALLSLALDPQPAAQEPLRQPAQQRLAQLLDAGATDFAQIWQRAGDKAHAFAVAALSTHPQCLDQAVASCGDEAFLERLVIAGTTARVRQAAAENIHDPARLKQLLKQARGKDKNVYKIIKRKWDQIQQQQQQRAELQATISSLCESIERHSRKPFDPLFTATLDHLNAQWSTISHEAPPQLVSRANTAIEIARQTITKQLQLLAKQAARAGALANADSEQQAVLRDLRALLASLYGLSSQEAPGTVERAQAQLTQHEERWQRAISHKPASQADAVAFDALRTALPAVIAAIQADGTLQQQIEQLRQPQAAADAAGQQRLEELLIPARLAVGMELPLVDEAQRVLAQLRATAQRSESQQAEQLRELSLLIRKAGGALNAGRSAQASRMRSSIERAMADLPALPSGLATQLQRLDERLAVLRDWQDYAAAPKRIELIQQMEALVGSSDEPPALAEAIQRLQAQWKTVSRGSAGQDDAQWRRFHEAAQAAYQPCREYFAAQAELRAANLAKRVALLERLADFEATYTWADADWRHVARVLREARQQWRSHSPTERTATKDVQERFDALVTQIQARLDTHLARNVERKRNLIVQAGKLCEEPDVARAVEELKQLQAAWKGVGLTPHQEDQALWSQFRAHADAIHARRQQHHEAERAALEGNQAAAVALCEQAEALAELSGPEVYEAAKTVAQLRDQLQAIERLPGNSTQALATRIQQAAARIDANVESHRRAQEEQRWNALLTAGNHLRLWRLAMLEQSCDQEAAYLAARGFIDSQRQWPKGALQLLQSEFSLPSTGDLIANEQALRLLCIRAEILTNLPTPLEDQSLRRSYQLESLVGGARQPSGTLMEQLDALLFAWVQVGATPTPIYEQLLARMQHCRGAANRSLSER